MKHKHPLFIIWIGLILSQPVFADSSILQITFQVPSNSGTDDGLFKIKNIDRIKSEDECTRVFGCGIDMYKFQFKKRNSSDVFYEKVFSLPPQKNDPSEMMIYLPDPESDFEISVLRNIPVTTIFVELQSIPVPLRFLDIPVKQTKNLKELCYAGDKSRFKIMLLSDGYTEDMCSAFIEDSQKMIDGFLSHPLIEPIKNQFTIYRKCTPSQSSFIPADDDEEKNKTLYLTERLFGDGLIISYDQAEIVSQAGPAIDFIFVIANSDLPWGMASFGNYVAIGKAAPIPTFVHEFLHLSLGLNDEYQSSQDIWNCVYRRHAVNFRCREKNHECIMNDPKQFQSLCPECLEAYHAYFKRYQVPK